MPILENSIIIKTQFPENSLCSPHEQPALERGVEL